jgi:hypothetical protein
MTIRANEGVGPARRALRLGALFAVFTMPAAALDLALPEGATIVAAMPPGAGVHTIATGPWDGTRLPTSDVTGTVRSAAWQVPVAQDLSIASITSGIEQQLRAQGYDVALACTAVTCGGFDFRHRIDMGQSPEMHVDIGNFRYLTARNAATADTVAVTVSQGGLMLYVHVVHVGDGTGDATWVTPSTRAPLTDETEAIAPTADLPPGEAIAQLVASRGRAARRSAVSHRRVRAIGGRLPLPPGARRVPGRRLRPSRGAGRSHRCRRWPREQYRFERGARGAVRRHLIDVLGVNPGQLDAAGIGYLAPRATNETAGGREANRRVEVVLLDGG